MRTDEPVAFAEPDPTTKFVLVAPAGTTTGELMLTTKLLLVIVTLAPPVGAALVNDTVHVPLLPAVIVAGEQDKLARAAGAGCTVSVADFVAPAEVAEMLGFCAVVTAVVVTLKDVLVEPLGTVTVAGTIAAALLLTTVTGVPPVGAADARLTVQEVLDPPVTVLGEQTMEVTAG